MVDAINFVKHRRRALTKLQQLDNKWFRYAGSALAVILVLFIAAVGARLALAFNVKSIKDEQNRFRQLVIDQEENERSFVIFVAKIKSLVDLFDKRRDKQAAIEFFTGSFDEDVLVSNITYDADESILAFGLESKDVFTLEKVFETVQSSTVKNQFQQVKLSELKRDPNGQYRLLVTVVLKGAEVVEEAPKASATPTTEEPSE